MNACVEIHHHPHSLAPHNNTHPTTMPNEKTYATRSKTQVMPTSDPTHPSSAPPATSVAGPDAPETKRASDKNREPTLTSPGAVRQGSDAAAEDDIAAMPTLYAAEAFANKQRSEFRHEVRVLRGCGDIYTVIVI